MEKGAEEVQVSTSGKQIFISQQHFGSHNEDQICLNPEQIDLLLTWLKEAKEEAIQEA